MQVLERILYAEDDTDIQQVALLALEMVGGFTIKSCNDGSEAVAAIADFNPQLLLFDVMMPNMDGPSALAKIRELEDFKTTPVIFMTAKVQPYEIQQYMDKGAAGVIAKPFDTMTLASQVQQIWEKSLP